MPARKRPPSPSAGPSAPAVSPSVHLPRFLRYLEAECGLAANTVRAYRADLEKFFEWYAVHGAGPLNRVDLKLLTDWLADLHERPLAASSIGRHLVSLKMFFRYLVLEGIVADSVVELLQSPKLWKHLPRVLSPEMVNRLLAAPTLDDRFAFRDRALLGLLYATGCRASEVAGLRLRDVHLDEAFCRCTGKGNKERLVSLNPPAVLSVRAYLEHERPQLAGSDDSEWLLVTRRGQAFTRVTVWKLVKKYAARIGLSQAVSPHTLRHSFATHMLAGGAEIRALQELLGHASIATTQIYTQVEHSRLKAVHLKCHPRG
ncbi:MAG TPA: site-specific tyrosine recombinase XerD [Planctomycetaceae bacterium]|nr:site-specific tyrosine recombinase XerD [Planctomycetaceae bacterium]